MTHCLNNADFRQEADKAQAADILRTLVEAIALVPEDGELKVELRGDIAGILSLCQTSKSPLGLSPEGLEQATTVYKSIGQNSDINSHPRQLCTLGLIKRL